MHGQKNIKFMIILPVVAESFFAEGRTDGQTDKHDEDLNHCRHV